MSILRKIRGEKTQKEMAVILGVSKSYYEKLERGAAPATRRIIEKIKALHPDIDINIFFT